MRRRWIWLTVFFPVALGAGISLVLSRTLAQPLSFYLNVDVVALAWLTGLLGSLVWGGFWMSRTWVERRCAARVVDLQTQTAKERRRFLQRLDHELKNPLTAIRAALANLDVSLTNGQQETLDSAQTQVLRISRLVSDLRKLAELETRPLEQAPVDMNALLQEVVVVMEEHPQAADRQITLTLPQAPWPLPPISGDWDLIFLALYNLMNNALKFTQTGDRVEVRAFEDGASVVIEVADTGPGIPEAEQSQVWEELYRGQSARGVPGSGLGLALVRAIVERHGGRANLRSRAGQGTVFTLRLPTG
jgi:two-component system OmpR family sensor kinase